MFELLSWPRRRRLPKVSKVIAEIREREIDGLVELHCSSPAIAYG
jgi:hypothetical protein